ncbi:hypothetical protein Tco_0044236 [Tanacetum coccineum]
MISEEIPKKSKEQTLQEEASLAEAIRLDSLQREEEAKQIHLDSLLAQRIAEEEELNKQQKKTDGKEGIAYNKEKKEWEDGTDIVYINFGAMMKSISRDDLTELYRIVMNRYGMNGLEDELERVFWNYLKNMFEEPLSTDPI